ncbi:MAG: rhodanese domain containing protein [Cenarchaeum symbiont of Oopsacas minuta]|nr:rhodanese domain containing protein [Cenarchaeum symbiont of Oopsacas minuta]
MAEKITIDDFNSQKENFTIIDVREPDEMAGGSILGSKNVPLGLVIRSAKKGQMDELKNNKICVYCASGYRGNLAADELAKTGFDVVNLEGGYMAWKQSTR